MEEIKIHRDGRDRSEANRRTYYRPDDPHSAVEEGLTLLHSQALVLRQGLFVV